ncbi:hypothetical protein [Actinomadura sp. WMMA1423]|uniref:hypothetical protein n=1 Tax=Actinomadura sp. WMMA1423 TaxID=2591108 RepID=UPI00143CFF05|nr:hypothetical protein [Actinomadura sp. WMMA1423]
MAEPTTPRPPVRWNVCPDCLGRHPDGAACLDEPLADWERNLLDRKDHETEPTEPRPDAPHERCGASSRIGFHYLVPYIGPCVLRRDHDGPVHEDANGTQWTDPRPAKAGDLAALCPPAGGLRERLTEALQQADAWAQLLPEDRARFADAVLPVVEEVLTEAERDARSRVDRWLKRALAATLIGFVIWGVVGIAWWVMA